MLLHEDPESTSKQGQARHDQDPVEAEQGAPLPAPATFKASMQLVFDKPDEQWLFSKDEYRQFPSCKRGMSVREELLARATGVFELFDACNMDSTKAPSLTMITAINFFHRFYAVEAFQDYPAENVAPACLFLAAKVEESSKKAENIAGGILRRRLELMNHEERPSVEAQGAERQKLSEIIIELEGVILNSLQYDIKLSHPHPIISHTLHIMLPSTRKRSDGHKRIPLDTLLMQTAWDLADTSFYLPLCLVYPPNVIAAACIFLAFRRLGLNPKEEIMRANYYCIHLFKLQDTKELEKVQHLTNNADQWCTIILQTEWQAVEPVVQDILMLMASADLKDLSTYSLAGLYPSDTPTPKRTFKDRIQKPASFQGRSPYPDTNSSRTPLPWGSSKTPMPSYLQPWGSGGQTPIVNELNPANEESQRLQHSSPNTLAQQGSASSGWGQQHTGGCDAGRSEPSRTPSRWVQPVKNETSW